MNASPIELRAHKSAVHTSIILGIVIMCFAAKSGIAIYESGIVDNTSVFESESLPYSDTSAVIYERDTDLYHIHFDGNRTFTCSSRMAKEYILDHINTEVKEIDKME